MVWHHDLSHPLLSRRPPGKSAALQRAIAAAIKAQLAVPWLPTNCRLPLHGETQVNSFKVAFCCQSAGLGEWPVQACLD